MKGRGRWGVCVAGTAILIAWRAGADGLELGGFLGTENYLGLRDGEFYDFRNANWLRLRLKARPSENATAVAEAEVRNSNFTTVHYLGDLWDRSQVEPVGLRLNEAWVELAGFLFDSDALTLDVRAGKQVLGWGEADGFNPTNYFDVYDLENPLDFKKRIGNVSLRATFTIAEEAAVLEAVVAPRFLPSVLPIPLFLGDDPLHSPLMPPLPQEMLDMLAALNIDLVNPTPQALLATPPKFLAEEVMVGARLKLNFEGVEVSLSGFHGHDSVPALSSGRGRLASGTANGCPQEGRGCFLVEEVRLSYPSIDVAGLDFRADLFGVGLWGEVGLVFPRPLEAVFFLGETQVGAIEVIEDTPFAKWTLGAEYTFSGGWYLNLQWVHGFFTEQTGHQLHDYLFWVMRQSFFSDRLQVELSLGGELDTTFGRRALGGVVAAEIAYQPSDGAKVTLGGAIARGEDGTRLSLFEELEQVFLKFDVGF